MCRRCRGFACSTYAAVRCIEGRFALAAPLQPWVICGTADYDGREAKGRQTA
jgi:hypothetical protein